MKKLLLSLTAALALAGAATAATSTDTYPGASFSAVSVFRFDVTGLPPGPSSAYQLSFSYVSDNGARHVEGSLGYDDLSQPDPYGELIFEAPTSGISHGLPGTLTAWLRDSTDPVNSPPVLVGDPPRPAEVTLHLP